MHVKRDDKPLMGQSTVLSIISRDLKRSDAYLKNAKEYGIETTSAFIKVVCKHSIRQPGTIKLLETIEKSKEDNRCTLQWGHVDPTRAIFSKSSLVEKDILSSIPEVDARVIRRTLIELKRVVSKEQFENIYFIEFPIYKETAKIIKRKKYG